MLRTLIFGHLQKETFVSIKETLPQIRKEPAKAVTHKGEHER